MKRMNCEQIEIRICRKLKAIRLMKNISQVNLATQAGVSRRTISRMENGEGVTLNTFLRVLSALGLESQLENLIPSTKIRPIERVQRKRERKNASSPRKKRKKQPDSPNTWQWGPDSGGHDSGGPGSGETGQ